MDLAPLHSKVTIYFSIKISRLRWLRHASRMDKSATARKVFEDVVEGSRKRGRPRLRWKDHVNEPLQKLSVPNCRELAKDRVGWRNILFSFCNVPGTTHTR